MQTFFHSLATGFAAIVLAVTGFFSPHVDAPIPVPNPVQAVGATNAVPTAVALFETSLATAITSSATTMTLTSATDKAGTTFASSTYAFVLDSGTSAEEMVVADCTGTACTNMTRGISPISGTTTVASLQFAHRRGASVKITDGPQLLILSRILNGVQTIPNKLSYTSAPSFLNGNELITKTYADGLAFGTLPVTVTSGGTGGSTQPQNMLLVGNGTSPITATSSPTVGYITSTSTATSTFAGDLNVGGLANFASTTATSTIAGGIRFTSTGHGITFADSTTQTTAFSTSNYQSFTSSGTWTKPSTATANSLVFIRMWGGGGGGGGSAIAGGSIGGGGGGGSYKEHYFLASQLGVTETVTVGAGGIGGVGAANGTHGATTTVGSLLSAYGGGFGTFGNGGSGAGGGGAGQTGSGAGAVTTTPGNGGTPIGGTSGTPPSYFGGGYGLVTGVSIYGGGGGAVASAGAPSTYGGGGGAGGTSAFAGGVSTYGGNGGANGTDANATNGAQPAGGGGGAYTSGGGTPAPFNGGNGGAGKVEIWTLN